jgi:hypothetical protein
MNRITQLKRIQEKALQIFEKKNADYGDAFADYGVIGVLVRLGDKIKRCASINKSHIIMTHDEKLRDTLIDLHNYAAMVLILLEEEDA